MSGSLEGRSFLVVGGGTRESVEPNAPLGNGRAIALAVATAGGRVTVSDLSSQAAEHTVNLVKSVGGVGHFLVADSADSSASEQVVHDAHRMMGGLDGVICNVGVGLGRGLEGTSSDQWDHVFAVNVRSHFLTLKAALGIMNAGSSSVLISSIAALRPGSSIPAYDASKAAQIALMRHAAREAAHTAGRVNVVAPGLIDTPLGRLATAARPGRATTRVPLGRQGTAEEVANVVVFLLSSDSSYVTGQVIAVDGGLSTLA